MDRYDAIIVLGAGVNEKGEIPAPVALRVKEAVRLLNEGAAPRIIMSGKWGYRVTEPLPFTEAAAMKKVAVAEGANPDNIILEEESLDTLGNAYFCKKLFLVPNDWRSVIVLMSDHHAERSEYLFRKVLGPSFNITIHPVSIDLTPEERAAKDTMHAKSIALAKKWLDPIADGDDAAIWQLMSTKHPAYAENPEISKEQMAQMLS